MPQCMLQHSHEIRNSESWNEGEDVVHFISFAADEHVTA